MKILKLPRTFLSFVLLLFFSIFVVAVAFQVYLAWRLPKPVAPNLSFSMPLNQTTYKVGQKILLPLYIQGTMAEKITAFDVKLNYDPSKLRLVTATPGSFFEKYFTIKWDKKETWFALAKTPVKPEKLASVSSPLLTLEFVVLSKTDSATVSTGTSTVYVANTGGFRPNGGHVNLNLK